MNWWQRLLKKPLLEQQLDAELRFHFDRQVAENIRKGMSPEQARRSARLTFGSLEELKEDCRDSRGTRWLENIVQDLVFSFRLMRRTPSFTIVAVICLALGIGANTAIFSVIDALMLRKLPVPQPGQLVVLGEGHAQGVNDDFPHNDLDLFSWPFYLALRANNAVFADVSAIRSSTLTVHGRFGGETGSLEPLKVRLVSGNFFAMLGVPPAAGRVLIPEDDRAQRAPAVAVMRYGYWQRRFAGDPSVIGRTISFNGAEVTIVGVAAADFSGIVVGSPPDFWAPLAMQQSSGGDPFGTLTQSLWLIARVKPGVTLTDAQANTNVRLRQWLHTAAGDSPSEERIQDMRKAHVKVTPAAHGLSQLRRQFSKPLKILMALVGLVLLIACANIANLLLARSATRRREFAVRLALGAPRRRLVAQLLAESVTLAFMGGLLGLLASIGGAKLLVSMVAKDANPVPLQIAPNSEVLLFTLGLSVLTGLIFGIMPALQMSGADSAPTLREGKGLTRSQTRSRSGRMLVAGQVALAFFLVVDAGLFVRTFQELEQANTGFEKDRVVLLQLDGDAVNVKGPALLNLYRRIETRIQALPGVEAASFSEVTFNEGHWRSSVWPDGIAHTEAGAKNMNGDHVGTQYFQVLRTPIILGRGFGIQDTAKSKHVAVVNETFARTLFPNVQPVGRRFWLTDRDVFEIVGVVKDAKYESVREATRGAFFLSNEQDTDPDGFSDLVVRTHRRPEDLENEIRAAIRSENPGLAITEMMTLSEQVDRSLREERLLATLAGFFGVLALLLAAIGLYGVIAYSVAGRTNEIGIRMALGARPAGILRAVLGESLALVAIGLMVGLPLALGSGRFISSQLYGVRSNDPWLIGTAAAVLLLAAFVASLLPARRAAHLDPVSALRNE